MTNSEKLKELFERLDEIEAYSRCLGKVQFDMECCAPEEGIEQAGADMSILGKYLYTLTHMPASRISPPNSILRWTSWPTRLTATG